MAREFLRISNLEARDLPEAWYLAIKEVVEYGHEYLVDRGSFEKEQRRRELDMFVMLIKHPGFPPLVPDIPPGLGLSPPTSIEYVEEYFNRYLMSSFKVETEEYTYGQDLEMQVPEVIKMFKDRKYNTNQSCMSVGSAMSIFLKDPQCLRVVQARIRYGKLHFIVYFRSWDLWSGFPSNLAGLQLVKEYILKEIGDLDLKDGSIIALSPGLHLYEFAWELADIRLHRKKK